MKDGIAQPTTLPFKLALNVDGAFEDLVLAHQRQVFLFACRMTGCTEEAEDVAQDTFIRAYQALKSYDSERIRAMQLHSWLFRIALNLTRNRAKRHRLKTEVLDGDSTPDSAPMNTPAEVYDRMERAGEMATHVAKLPHRMRAPIVLRYVNDLSYEEIAEVLEQPTGTVKSNVHRGIGLLRKSIEASPTSEGEPEVTR